MWYAYTYQSTYLQPPYTQQWPCLNNESNVIVMNENHLFSSHLWLCISLDHCPCKVASRSQEPCFPLVVPWAAKESCHVHPNITYQHWCFACSWYIGCSLQKAVYLVVLIQSLVWAPHSFFVPDPALLAIVPLLIVSSRVMSIHQEFWLVVSTRTYCLFCCRRIRPIIIGRTNLVWIHKAVINQSLHNFLDWLLHYACGYKVH